MSRVEEDRLSGRSNLVLTIWQRLRREIESRGGNEGDMDILIQRNSDGVVGLLADYVIKLRDIYSQDYFVRDNYNSFAEMITAGQYCHVGASVTAEHFGIEGGFVINDKMAVYEVGEGDKEFESEEICAELELLSLRPATLIELCAFAANCSYTQLPVDIVALGSVYEYSDHGKDVGVLNCWGDLRRLTLESWWGTWSKNFKFLAVRI